MDTEYKAELSDSDHLYLELWQQLLRCTKTLEQEISNRFRKHFKQSMTRFDLLSQLAKQPLPWLAIGKVAEQLLSSNGNITKLVERMVAENLLERRNSSIDRRITEISMTDKGRELYREMALAHASWTQDLMDNYLLPADAQQLNDLLSKANSDD